ncbi:MAG TPA: hypothetical protein VNJ08_16055 [Bacteriovoracaceae bacterium]|nr:hypothetical protein [Bacteriovoracaceae bacterium]
MKFLFFILFIGNSLAGTQLAPDWVSETSNKATTEVGEAYELILNSHAKALDKMGDKSFLKNSSFGFDMDEMVTDMAVSKSGDLGIAAMKANSGLEIKWKKKRFDSIIVVDEAKDVDFVVPNKVSDIELATLADSIRNVVLASGKIKDSQLLRSNIYAALESVRSQVNAIDVTSYDKWRVGFLRLDLSFSVSGKVYLFIKAGVALRLRMEWNLRDVPLTNNKIASMNDHTKFVVKTLAELNNALVKVPVPGFEPKKIMIGVGVFKMRFGLWKLSAGFVGWLGFVPVRYSNYKSRIPVVIPPSILDEDFSIGGGPEETTDNKIWWPWKRKAITRTSFATGMEKSLTTAAFFAERARVNRSTHWQVDEVKTVNDISQTGFFSLADISNRGIVEIDFKRK